MSDDLFCAFIVTQSAASELACLSISNGNLSSARIPHGIPMATKFSKLTAQSYMKEVLKHCGQITRADRIRSLDRSWVNALHWDPGVPNPTGSVILSLIAKRNLYTIEIGTSTSNGSASRPLRIKPKSSRDIGNIHDSVSVTTGHNSVVTQGTVDILKTEHQRQHQTTI